MSQLMAGWLAELKAIAAGFSFPPEWTNAVLVLALMSICMVVTLFAYLNFRTKKPYFNLWICGWIFYAVYLAAALGLQESPDMSLFVMLRRACIGLSALFMFWGSFHLSGRPRSFKELKFASAMILVWSAVAAFVVRDRFWITMPVFALLAAAGFYTGITYFLRRKHYHGATILGVGFLLWGLHLLAFTYLETSPGLMTIAYAGTAVVAVMIVIGMIMEREVNAAEQVLRVLFDSSPDPIIIVDQFTQQILDVNAAALRFTKYESVDLVGRSFPEICPSLKSDSQISTMHLYNSIFRPFSEVPIIRADGKSFNCEGESIRTQWHQRPVLQVCLRDISERKKVGQQMRRAEKLSALGQLIAGVAHELNNPLAVVMGFTQVMTARTNLDEKTRADLRRILHESERASKIVSDLLAYARPSDPHKTATDINRLVASVLETHETELQAAGIQVETNLAKDVPKTMADYHQIEQVVVNLLTNAIYALGTQPKPRILKMSTEDNGNFVRIIVADNGPGIPSDNIAKLFDPFFTTKPLGKGTGLGLTICNTVIQEHRGKILVESTPKQGATFTVELPVVACVAETASQPQRKIMPAAKPQPPSDTKPSVLLVDDEPGILAVMTEVIGGLGYQVTTATNGHEALEQIDKGTFDVMLSDMRMPGMDGGQLYEALKAKNHKLANRMIFVTGDTVSADTHAFLELTGNRWLSKPFNIQQVVDVLEDVLKKQMVGAAVN